MSLEVNGRNWKTGGQTPYIRWSNVWQTGYQHMRLKTTRTRKDKDSTRHDCFFGLPNLKVSHLGWTAYRSNLVSPEQNWWRHSVGVLVWAWYHASWFMDSTRPCSSLGRSCQSWWWATMPEGCSWGCPGMEQAIGSHMTSSLTGEACGPCWETFLQDECDLPDDALNHDPTGGRKRDGLAVNGDSGHPGT